MTEVTNPPDKDGVSEERLNALLRPIYSAVPEYPGAVNSPMKAAAINGASWEEVASMAGELLALRRSAPAVVTEAKLKWAVDGLQIALDEFDRECDYQASIEGENTELWDEIEVNADAVRAVIAALSVRAEPETETCETCPGNGELVTDWDRYLHGPLDENGNDAVMECPDCNGEGTVTPVRAEPVAVKPMDMSNLLRHAFLAGRGLSSGDKLSDEDLAAWVGYDPEGTPAYERIRSALVKAPAPADASALSNALAKFAESRSNNLGFHSKVYGDDDDEPTHDKWVIWQESGPINDREWDVLAAAESPAAALLALVGGAPPPAVPDGWKLRAAYEDGWHDAMRGKSDYPTHRHKKRGTEYVLLGIGKMQAENWVEEKPGTIWHPCVDMRQVAIYQSTDDGSLWARPIEEWEDGRFEALPAPSQPLVRGDAA